MNQDKALKMFEDKSKEMYKIMKNDSCNVMVEEAMILGYDYAKIVEDEHGD